MITKCVYVVKMLRPEEERPEAWSILKMTREEISSQLPDGIGCTDRIPMSSYSAEEIAKEFSHFGIKAEVRKEKENFLVGIPAESVRKYLDTILESASMQIKAMRRQLAQKKEPDYSLFEIAVGLYDRFGSLRIHEYDESGENLQYAFQTWLLQKLADADCKKESTIRFVISQIFACYDAFGVCYEGLD